MCGSGSFTGQVCVHITYSCRSSLGMTEEFLIIIMVIELSGVQFGLKSYVSKSREFDLKSQV